MTKQSLIDLINHYVIEDNDVLYYVDGHEIKGELDIDLLENFQDREISYWENYAD